MIENQISQTPSIYDQVGEQGFERLVAAFYRRIAAEPILRRLYPDDDLAPAERRLRMFLIQYFGGPMQYDIERGHPRLRMRHSPFRIGNAERDAWVKAMLGALSEVNIAEPARSTMHEYFDKTATFLMNTPPASDP